MWTKRGIPAFFLLDKLRIDVLALKTAVEQVYLLTLVGLGEKSNNGFNLPSINFTLYVQSITYEVLGSIPGRTHSSCDREVDSLWQRRFSAGVRFPPTLHSKSITLN
jgi:hypothetical protein